MATCKTCGTKLRVTAGWSVYGTDETGASHIPARCRDVLAARVAEVTRDERSAVERGNSLAREVQDERAHLGVALRELRRAVVRESAGVNPDEPRGIELQPGNCLDVLDVVRGVRRERDSERAAHALTRARLEAAERVVEAARPMRAHYSVAGRNLTEAIDALDALPAAAPARAGDDS